MDLIGGAARALAKFQKGRDNWDSLSTIEQDRFREGVRIALGILRDPDDRMTEAGLEIVRNIRPAESEEAYLNDAANTWRFMIDVLLASDERPTIQQT